MGTFFLLPTHTVPECFSSIEAGGAGPQGMQAPKAEFKDAKSPS